MATITKPNTFSAGGTIVASEHNDNFDTIYNDYNGSISNANISGSAAIADSKLAQITTASKVSGAALTSLSSVPSGAGALPVANQVVAASALTSSTTITIADFSLFDYYTLTPGENFTLANPTTDGTAGQRFIFKITQDGTGSRTIAFGNKWKSSIEIGDITLSTAQNSIDMFGGIYDGTNYLIVAYATQVSQSA